MNYEFYIRHRCYLKLCCVFTGNSDGISIRTSVSTSASEDQYMCLRWSLMNKICAQHTLTLIKILTMSSALRSARISLSQEHSDCHQAEHSEVSTLLHSRQINYQRHYSKTKIFSKWKERYEHWNGIMDNNVSIPRIFKQISEKRNG